MHHGEGACSLEFHYEIPVGYGVKAVCADLAKAQFPGQEVTVYGVRDASQSAATKWQDIGAVQAVPESLFISLKHIEIGQQVVGEKDRLSLLQVSIARHYYVLVCLGQLQQRRLQIVQPGDGPAGLFFEEKPDIQSYLVIS